MRTTKIRIRICLRRRSSGRGRQRTALCRSAGNMVSESRVSSGELRSGVSLPARLDACCDGKAVKAGGERRDIGSAAFTVDIRSSDTDSRIQPRKIPRGHDTCGRCNSRDVCDEGVERDFPSAPIQVIQAPRPIAPTAMPTPRVIAPSILSPVQHEAMVGEAAAHAIEYFAARFGPFPYSQLALTQLPGRESQGWPGLVFLSSYAFLDDQQRQQLKFDQYRILLQKSVPHTRRRTSGGAIW